VNSSPAALRGAVQTFFAARSLKKEAAGTSPAARRPRMAALPEETAPFEASGMGTRAVTGGGSPDR